MRARFIRYFDVGETVWQMVFFGSCPSPHTCKPEMAKNTHTSGSSVKVIGGPHAQIDSHGKPKKILLYYYYFRTCHCRGVRLSGPYNIWYIYIILFAWHNIIHEYILYYNTYTCAYYYIIHLILLLSCYNIISLYVSTAIVRVCRNNNKLYNIIIIMCLLNASRGNGQYCCCPRILPRTRRRRHLLKIVWNPPTFCHTRFIILYA